MNRNDIKRTEELFPIKKELLLLLFGLLWIESISTAWKSVISSMTNVGVELFFFKVYEENKFLIKTLHLSELIGIQN